MTLHDMYNNNIYFAIDTKSNFMCHSALQQFYRTYAASMEIFLPKYRDTGVVFYRTCSEHVQQRRGIRLERTELNVSQLLGDIHSAIAFIPLRHM